MPRSRRIYDTWIEDGKERRELNPAETEGAKEKLAKIKSAFERWVWQDAQPRRPAVQTVQ